MPLIEERSPLTEPLEPYRVLVCGDRNWTDAGKIMLALKRIVSALGEQRVVVVHGKARGADTLGGVAGKALGLEIEEHPAQWDKFGRAAGPIRNQEMLDSGLAYAVACHSDLTTSKGTKDMVGRLEKAGVPYELVT